MIGILNPIIEAGIYSAMREPVTLTSQAAFIRAFPAAGVFHVAVDDATGQLLGMQDVLPATTPGAGDISTFVALHAHRRGIGARLMAATLATARARGYTTIHADIRPDNPAAIAFYRRQGFEKVDENAIRVRLARCV